MDIIKVYTQLTLYGVSQNGNRPYSVKADIRLLASIGIRVQVNFGGPKMHFTKQLLKLIIWQQVSVLMTEVKWSHAGLG